MLEVPCERLPHGLDLDLPRAATVGAAGLDLVAALPVDRPLPLSSLERGLVPTGLRLALPPGFEGQIRPRSGLALRYGITVLNAPGTIDGDYRGEVMVLLVNLGVESFVVRRGMRIAQLVVAPVGAAVLIETHHGLDNSPRGVGGFGSTGA